METNNLISVELQHPEIERFSRFMQVTTDNLRKDAMGHIEQYSKQNGEKLEQVVLDKMRTLAPDFNINPEEICHTPKQHFPDILMGNTFGVEVKSTKEKSWQSVGSSIVESLRDDQVKKVFLLFGRLSAPDIDFRCKPYEDCLYDIAVTHSPRYLINMDINDREQTIFGKMNVDYDSFRGSGNQIDIVRDYYRKKYQDNERKGQMPWWIGEKQSSSVQYEPSSLTDGSSIRLLNTLDSPAVDYLKVCAYILFPEVVGKGTTKYQNYSLWLCSRYSIICSSLRDQFSAGGQGNIYINNKLQWSNVPKAICNFLVHIDKIRSIMRNHTDVYNDISYYAEYYDNNNPVSIFDQWKTAIDHHISKVVGSKNISINTLLHLSFDHSIGNDYFTTAK